ncbi:TonB-dependent receptor [Methylophaga sp.]|jgi:vitamin B12 transporter|uniref:TonB-dependent receptor domain-containing protein n=1 Tax=Methylophaga sp. TaxID=2024840 RepID=UPI0013FEB7EE|nr:TonB-dependent receptor [Methylophaga sp.]MTI64092.1 TonB-dependent receptor [Methylophaga sp.]
MLFKKTFLSKAVSTSLLTLLSMPAHAEPEKLEQIVVTDTRTDTSVSDTLSSISVVTREDIERYDYRTIAEALNSLPGVVIGNSGGLGKQTSLFIRGTESNHTQILLNGAKLATNEFGAPQIEHIPIQSIERIELVRGPQSSLYGSSSIGGTIQIFTRDKQSGFQPRLSIAAGSHNTKETNIGFSAGNELAWFNFDAGHLDSDGFDSCDGRSATLGIGCFADEPDNDGYRNKNYSLRAGTQLGSRLNLEAFKLYSSGRTHYDGFYNETLFEQYTTGLTAKADLTDIWKLTSSVSKSIFDSRNFGADTNRFENKKNTFSIQSDVSIKDNHIFTLGYDYEDDKVEALSGYDEAERENNAYFAQLQGRFGDHDYRFSIREDDNEQYGSDTSVNAAWGYQFTANTRAYINYGEAFSAPSFVDVFSPFGANPDLEPEESESIEVGIAGNVTNVDWTVAAFRTRVDNLIILDDFFVPQNISEAMIKGVEFTASTVLFGVNLNGQFSLLDPENKADNENRGNVLPRRAEQTLTINAFKQFGQYSLGTKLYVSGRRFDDAANERRLSSFTTLDIVGGYQIAPSTSLKLKVANLFDEQYETVAGFNSDSTNVMLSLHYSP